MKQLVIYTQGNCPWCVKAKKLAKDLGLNYEEIQQKHPDWPTVPYIVADGEPIGGFTEFAAACRLQ